MRKRLTLSLDENLAVQLEAVSHRTGLTYAEITREALCHYIRSKNRPSAWGDMKGRIRVAEDFCAELEDMQSYMR